MPSNKEDAESNMAIQLVIEEFPVCFVTSVSRSKVVFNLSKNIKQTAGIHVNITRQPML